MPKKVKHVLRHRFRDPDDDRLYVPHPQGKPVEVPAKLAERDKFLSDEEEDDEGTAPAEGTPLEEVQGLPHKGQLRSAGLTTVEAVEAAREDLEDFDGIGQVIAERVRDFLDQREAAGEGEEGEEEGEAAAESEEEAGEEEDQEAEEEEEEE